MMFFSPSGQFCDSLVLLKYDVYSFQVSGRATVENGCYFRLLHGPLAPVYLRPIYEPGMPIKPRASASLVVFSKRNGAK